MVEKLNKTKLFDPAEMYHEYGDSGIFDDDVMNEISDAFDKDLANYPAFKKLIGKIQEMYALTKPEDFDKIYKYKDIIVKIDAGNAKVQIKNLYDETINYMNKIDDSVDRLSKEFQKLKSKVSTIKNKDQLKNAKGSLQCIKSLYKGCVKISSMYLRQSVVLANIMFGYVHNSNAEEGNTEENTEKEEA